jgi:SAM-dependent methyltransferase
MGDYLFDQAWTQEKRRLDALGAMYDGGTFEHLSRLGIAAGWRCLEVGAGSGTVARWMAARVGREGVVVATDIDPRFLADLADAGIEVRAHDITTDPLEVATYDLVHARAVLQHVPRRQAALARMAGALRPGGRLLVEDIVSPSPTCHPPLPAWAKILAGIDRGLRGVGADPDYGLALPAALADAGLVEIDCAARVAMLRSGTPGMDFVALSVEHVGARLVGAGVVTAAELAETLGALRTPGYTTTAATMIAAWGTRAAEA